MNMLYTLLSRVGVITFLVCSIGHYDLCQQEVVSFDQFFPDTTYKQAVVSCMKAWGGLRCLQRKSLSYEERIVIQQHLLPHLAEMRACIQELTEAPAGGGIILQEHWAYLYALLLRIYQEQYDNLKSVPCALSILVQCYEYVACLLSEQSIQEQ